MNTAIGSREGAHRGRGKHVHARGIHTHTQPLQGAHPHRSKRTTPLWGWRMRRCALRALIAACAACAAGAAAGGCQQCEHATFASGRWRARHYIRQRLCRAGKWHGWHGIRCRLAPRPLWQLCCQGVTECVRIGAGGRRRARCSRGAPGRIRAALLSAVGCMAASANAARRAHFAGHSRHDGWRARLRRLRFRTRWAPRGSCPCAARPSAAI